MQLNISVRSTNGTDHDKTLYLPSFKPAQNTTPSTKDLTDLHELVWGMKQAVELQKIHWNAESMEIESRAPESLEIESRAPRHWHAHYQFFVDW